MNKKYSTFFYIVALILFCSSFPISVFAEENGYRIDELSEMDAFHPPEINDPRIMMYREWQYFNIIDEEQNLTFITTMTLTGNIYDPTKSAAVVLVNYITPEKSNLTINAFPISLSQWSDKSPDLIISSSSIKLTEQGYHVHVESEDTIFDAIFKPEAENGTIFSVPANSERIINWFVASPKMKVNGEFTIKKGTTQEKTYILKNIKGYHDHNWGFWLWQDDLGWDWGQASGKYTIAFGNITNNNHTESKSAVLEVWKNSKREAVFNDNEINIHREKMISITGLPDNPFPMTTEISAISGENRLNALFTTERFTPIPLPIPGGFRIIWELSGKYDVSGNVHGKPVSYKTNGYLEYVADLFMP